MPVQTSVITGTVAHKHSATGGSSDGGKLEVGGLGGDTSFNLASGSIMYSNGTSLVELTKGSDGNSLQLSSGLPTWAAPAGSTWNIIDQQTVAGTSIDTGSHSAADSYNELFFSCVFDADVTNAPEIQWYDTTGSLMTSAYYQVCGFYNNANFQQIDKTSALLTNNIAISAETVNIQIRVFNKKVVGNGGGSYTIATRDNGGTGSIYNKGFSGGTAAAIRGFKLIAPTTIDNAFYVLMGA